jgi:hypothetical protein
MVSMFKNANSFNQDLSTWNITSVTSPGMTNMFDSSELSTYNYTILLIGWGSQSVQSNITLGALGKQYYLDAVSPKNNILQLLSDS